MMLWQWHDAFDKDIKKLLKEYRDFSNSLVKAQRLLGVQFHPTNPQSIIGPGKLHRVTQNQTWAIWKLEVAVKGLRPNQWPRVWFAVSGDTVTFLVAQTHMNNYDNNECDRLAAERFSEIA